MKLLFTILLTSLSYFSYSSESRINISHKQDNHSSVNHQDDLIVADLADDIYDDDDFDFLKKIHPLNFITSCKTIFYVFPKAYSYKFHRKAKPTQFLLHKICVLRL